ncbi:MAG: protein kinase [Eubacterium sp.]|nr:protein kinase [Eubacterium sp.]
MNAQSNETAQKAMDEDFPLALPKGTILAGQYTIEKVLGQGGFGITYMATDYKTKEKVAVKEFFPDSLAYREMTTVMSYPGERAENYEYGKENFLQEAKTLAEFIGCENIVRIFSYFEENGTAYFVMEYINGVSFDNYLKDKGGKISCDEAKNILVPVMEALAVVHSKGIVHRDVTPDNIYITNDGTVKLLDFGAARYSLGDKSKSLDIILKHGFAPKEQYTRRGKQGPFTDIYSLGATFYFAVTGRRPPDSIDRMEEDELIPPSSLGVKITSYQEEAVLRALEVNPQSRYQSMLDFRNVMLNETNPAPQIPQQTNVTQQFFDAPPVPAAMPAQQISYTSQQVPYTTQQPYPMPQQQPYPMTQQQYPTEQQPYTTQQQYYPTQQQPYPMSPQTYSMPGQQSENVSKQIGDAAKQLGSAAVQLGGGVAKQLGSTAKHLGKSAAKHMSSAAKQLSETAATVKENAAAAKEAKEAAAAAKNNKPEPAVQLPESEAVQAETAVIPKKRGINKIVIVLLIVLAAAGVILLARGIFDGNGKAGTGNPVLIGETFGNIQNGGIKAYSGETFYNITYDGHSIMKDNETTLFENKNKTYSNLICDDDGLYYVEDGRICYYDFKEREGKVFSKLKKYKGNDLRLYMSLDYYFVYVNGKLHRITKNNGKEEQSIAVESPDKFALCGRYLVYIGEHPEHGSAVYKVPATDFSQNINYWYKENSDIYYFDSIVSDGTSVYTFTKSYNEPKFYQFSKYNLDFETVYYGKLTEDIELYVSGSSYSISGFNALDDRFSFTVSGSNGTEKLFVYMVINGDFYFYTFDSCNEKTYLKYRASADEYRIHFYNKDDNELHYYSY